ncbi:MAG TPA: exodeoxyribonuclease VII small subunit [Limnochordia bacterium]|nr:exodeoxyribonuclease VII small subunit [Limnochordia bacterium]
MSQEKELTFEEAFARLEQIVRQLEGGEVNLEESLRLFEEGVRLSRYCAQQLDAAEGKIVRLVEKPDGTVDEEPFDVLPGAASS